MKSLVIFILCGICCCKTHNSVCQSFDVNSKSLEVNCDHFQGKWPKNCSNELKIVNRTDVKQLKFKECDNRTIVKVIEMLGNVNELIIYNSGVESLNWLMELPQLQQLQYLNVSHNLIKEVPSSFTKNLRDIFVIDLSHNKITAFDHSDSFIGAAKLLKIYLSNNLIATIENDTFTNSPDLEYIDLRQNLLNVIPHFPNNKNVKSIHLEGNEILNFDCFSILNQNPMSLYVPWKNLFTFDQHKTCQSTQMLVISNSSYEGIHTTTDGSIEFHCNKYSFYNLQLFIVGRNAFKNIVNILPCLNSSIKIMILSDNYIGEFNTTILNQFINLQRLQLSNTALTGFNVNGIKNRELLLALDLSHNHLTHINDIGLLWNLQELDVGGNQLLDISRIIEELPQTLIYLDVHGNFIGQLNVTTFERLIELQSLNLSNTNLSISYFNPFERLENLSFLDISHNNLADVNVSVLSKTLKNLIEFNAAYCQINDVSEAIQQLRPLLGKLNLSGNFVGQLDRRSFEWLFNLAELRLRNAKIRHFDPKIFEYLLSLVILDLAHNELTVINFQLMSDKLEVINLEGNKLVTIDHLTPSKMQTVILSISDNQLSCTYLKQLKRKVEHITYLGNPLQQKHGLDCQSSKQCISDFLGTVYRQVKFW